jgi:hypothetical protein
MSSAAKVLKIARAEIGYKESPANSNKTKYGKEYGMNSQPWCAMFVWWVFKHAGCPELFYGGKKSAYCPTIADYYIAKKQTVSKGSGKAGDIVLFDWNDSGMSDHIGIIEKKNADGSYTTIEGNTAVGNDSNGGKVMRRTRYQKDISWICRPKYTEKEDAKEQLKVDGEWGEATTRASQVVFGTIEDGEVSGQLISCKKYLPNCNTGSWEFVKSSKNGSTLIKAIQKLVEVKQDGKAGKNTAYKMQIFLKAKGFYTGKYTKKLDKATVMAWQKYINSRL